jgi:PST family polysaccharide transporter
VLGLAGAALVILCAVPISSITFGSSHPASGVALLSFAVLIRTISTGQTALLQGLRRISELARMNILAGALGTALTVPLIFAFGEQGVVLAVIAIAAASLFASWTYSRRILLADVRFLRSQMGRETLALLTLGVSFLVSSLLTLGAAYVVRILVLRAGGIESAGIYQAAWTIGGLYAAFILSAMGTDFYPRLTAVSTNNAECNRLVNEQTRISLLLAGPGVLATVTFAPLILTVFFSKDFLPAANILRWICLGMMLRISSWPMGFIVLAKGAQKIFVWTEVAATVVHVGLAWLLVDQVGVDGAGIAFFGLYVWHTAFIYVIVRRLSGFDWSRDNVKLALLFLTTTAGVLCGLRYLPMWSGLALGGGAVIICGLYSVREVLALVTFERLPGPLQSWFGTKAGRA